MCLRAHGGATAKIITSSLPAAKPSSVWLNEVPVQRRSSSFSRALESGIIICGGATAQAREAEINVEAGMTTPAGRALKGLRQISVFVIPPWPSYLARTPETVTATE